MFTLIKPEKLDYVVIKGQARQADYEKIDELAKTIIEKHQSL